MNYSYIDKPNPWAANRQFHGYTSRSRVVKYIVIHTGEIAADIIGPDSSAESLTNYMSNSTRQVSWHATTDADTVLHNLPHSYTAFHVAGHNSQSIGIEQGIYARQWNELPKAHIEAMIDNLALVVCWYSQIYNIQIKWLTQAEYNAGQNGIISHAMLNPGSRTDPGPDFPFQLFMNKVNLYNESPVYGIGDGGRFREQLNPQIKEIQKELTDRGYGSIVGIIDGDAGPKFDAAVRAYESDLGLSETGLYTKTRYKVKDTTTARPLNASVEITRDGESMDLSGELVIKVIGA